MFKVGDRVRVTGDNIGNVSIGAIGTVTEIYGDGTGEYPYWVKSNYNKEGLYSKVEKIGDSMNKYCPDTTLAIDLVSKLGLLAFEEKIRKQLSPIAALTTDSVRGPRSPHSTTTVDLSILGLSTLSTAFSALDVKSSRRVASPSPSRPWFSSAWILLPIL